jgi:hypothetical protein
MIDRLRKSLGALVALLLSTACAGGSPCDGVDRTLTIERKASLATEIAKQLSTASTDVLQSFQSGGWSIIYVGTHQSDEVFLFYSRDPLTSRYITIWSGAAASGEERKIRDWTLKNAPGIPQNLANCFAWHVTKDRDL